MRKLILIVSLVFVFATANSQNLTVEGTAPDLYVTHTVAPKENFYSVGRLYNQAPKTIASFNNIPMEKGLTIGQHIKIPLTSQNLDVTGSAGAGETLIPLTHIVAKSETLTKIGSDFKVTPQMVKQWNSLSSDNINPGSPLIVAHLKVKSAEQSANVNRPSSPVVTEAPVARREPVSEPVQRATPNNTPTSEVRSETPAQTATSTPQPKKEEAANTRAVTRDTALALSPQTTNNTVVAEREKPKASPGYQQETSRLGGTPSRNEVSMTSGSLPPEGAFSSLFSSNTMQRSLKNKSGDAATFKSTSGWQDKKYYVLMDNVTPGTILKISAADKVVYAKVLGSMPEMKENNGLLLRISNSAASSLGIIDPKFPVEVSYYQ